MEMPPLILKTVILIWFDLCMMKLFVARQYFVLFHFKLFFFKFLTLSSPLRVIKPFVSLQGQYKFKCPALNEDTYETCGVVWSYPEVRRLAALTVEEMAYFEEKIAQLAARDYCELKIVSLL